MCSRTFKKGEKKNLKSRKIDDNPRTKVQIGQLFRNGGSMIFIVYFLALSDYDIFRQKLVKNHGMTFLSTF